MKAAVVFADCPTCRGFGSIRASDDEQPCPGCNLKARAADRIRAAAEDSTEALYKEQYGPEYDRLATYQVEGR